MYTNKCMLFSDNVAIVIIMSFKQSNETNHVNIISFSTLDHDLLWDLATQVIAIAPSYTYRVTTYMHGRF